MNSNKFPVKKSNGFKQLLILIHTFFVILLKYKSTRKTITILKSIKNSGRAFYGSDKIEKSFQLNNYIFWNSDIPGWRWNSIAYKKFILNESSRYIPLNSIQSNLNMVIFSITNKCSLKCKHCFDWKNLNNHDYLTYEELQSILFKILQTNVSSIQFSGGEPLNRFSDLVELIKLCQSKTETWLLTSGFGLTEEKALQLKKAGLTGVYISLDHWKEDAHNIFRDNGSSFKWVTDAASNCKNAGLVYGVSLCATKDFITKENLYNYLYHVKNIGAQFIRILEVRSIGKFANQNVELEKSHIDLLREFYLEVNYSNKWIDYPIIIFPGSYQHIIGCYGSGDRYLYIDSMGEVHSCPFCQGSVGNILHQDIETLIKKLRTNGCQKFKPVLTNIVQTN